MFIAFERFLDNNNELEFGRWTRRTFNYSVACSLKWLSTSYVVLYLVAIRSMISWPNIKIELLCKKHFITSFWIWRVFSTSLITERAFFVFIGISKAFRHELKRYMFKLVGQDLVVLRAEDQQHPEPKSNVVVLIWFIVCRWLNTDNDHTFCSTH